ncbi:MAG: helix-turn-helix domain-containing protein [Rhodospirillaceae bacterium]|nr:helix-turn-helix domain-containing protein [Rhodospirillales bacterium]
MQQHTDNTAPQGWHRAKIRAEVAMRGKTLKQLALDNDLHPAACQRAVAARNTPGERAIAAFLEVPLWELWPDRWTAPEVEGAPAIRIDNRRR